MTIAIGKIRIIRYTQEYMCGSKTTKHWRFRIAQRSCWRLISRTRWDI